MSSTIPVHGFPQLTGKTPDKKAIACWAATGFFLENDTFWKEVKWEELDYSRHNWNYEPRSISFDQAVEEFSKLFEEIVKEQTANKKIILPLSGGLDSRTLAAALKKLNIQPYTYSYQFPGSFHEAWYGRQISKSQGWEFDEYTIPEGYLWNHIEEFGSINKCYAEFTHARQAAVTSEISSRGDVWLLGHWGDVLFDNFNLPSDTSDSEQLNLLLKKIPKKGGMELAADLWKAWELEGTFSSYFENRLKGMLDKIPISNANARLRAFKSLYWAPRWTSTNLEFFAHYKPVSLPYYDNRMCDFIMRLPEAYLSGRKIQIEYIKRNAPELAAIPWQAHKPFNLYNYSFNKTPWNIPYRLFNRARLSLNKLAGQPLIQRNWEIQFTGESNDLQLTNWLFENRKLDQLIPLEIRKHYYQQFRNGNKVYWSHAVSMLLTLSVFSKQHS